MIAYYQRSNDASSVCEKTGTFTPLLTHPTTQACVQQSTTVTFNGKAPSRTLREMPTLSPGGAGTGSTPYRCATVLSRKFIEPLSVSDVAPLATA